MKWYYNVTRIPRDQPRGSLATTCVGPFDKFEDAMDSMILDWMSAKGGEIRRAINAGEFRGLEFYQDEPVEVVVPSEVDADANN